MPSTHHQALPAGYRLHWYEIESVLGQGGFGITYLAHDINLQQKVAIKEYLPTELATRTADSTVHPIHEGHNDTFGWGLNRFLSEARTLAQFEHPNIVRVLAVFEANNTAYMVMRYEEGRPLDDLLKFNRLHGEAALRAVIDPLLDGLAKVHERGFIHRDIKPANIFIRSGDSPDEQGSPVLIDFGSARQALGAETRTLTALVSPGYAPFEQYNATADNDRQGPWTDIYALGATLYRAVTGKGPVDAMVRVSGVLEGRDPLEPAREAARGEFSPAFLAAIDAALAFQPDRRPQNIAEWRAMFDSAPPAAPPAEATGDDAPTEVRVSTRRPGAEGGAASGTTRPTSDTVADPSADATRTPPHTAPAPTPELAASAPEPAAPAAPRRRPGAGLLVGVLLLAATGGWLWLDNRQAPTAPPSSTATTSEQSASTRAETGRNEVAADNAAEEQARRQAELAARQAAAEEARRQAELATRQAAAEEARRQAELATRQAAAEEARRQAELATRQTAEQEARRQAELAASQQSSGARLDALLDTADADITALRLTSPPGNNALEKLREVLATEPDNPRALAGLDGIVGRYVTLAEEAAASGRFERAQGYLARADAVLPGAERVLFAREALEQQATAARKAASAPTAPDTVASAPAASATTASPASNSGNIALPAVPPAISGPPDAIAATSTEALSSSTGRIVTVMPFRRVGTFGLGDPNAGRALIRNIRGGINDTPGARIAKVHAPSDQFAPPEVTDAALWEDGFGGLTPRAAGLLAAARSDAADTVVLVAARPSRGTRNTGRYPVDVYVYDARDGRLLEDKGDNGSVRTIVSRLLGQL